MLDIGTDIAVGGLRVLGYVERDAFAAAVLLERMEDEAMEPAPIFAGDLAGFPWGSFHGLVDIVTAGFPCQPHSVAGARAGVEDERWIWPDIMAGIRILRPGLVVLENVSGIRSSGGLAPVLGDLASSGFRVAWTSLRADEVGAAHERERVFIVGVADAVRSGWAQRRAESGSGPAAGAGGALADARRECAERRGDAGKFRGAAPAEHRQGLQRQRHGCAAGDGGADVADHHDAGRGEQWVGGLLDGQRTALGHDADGRGEGLGDSEREGSQGRGPSIAARRDEPRRAGADRPVFAPGPEDTWWKECPKWLRPAVEPGFFGLADGVAVVVDEGRADQLRAIGNGVVPLQAAVAVRHLLRTLMRAP